MTVETRPPRNEAGDNGSSADDWSALAPPVTDVTPEPQVPDTSPADVPVCPTCGDPIIREPGARGRAPKYHPGHRPSDQASHQAKARTGPRVSGKAEKEADEAVAILKAGFAKVAIAVSMVDRFDAFCIMVNANAICESFRGVCIRYDDFRKEVLSVKSGGSVIGLAFSVITMAAPILAHHGLIPQKHIQKILVELPYTLYGIQKRMREGQDAMTNLMEEQAAMFREDRNREARNAQAGQNGHAAAPVI